MPLSAKQIRDEIERGNIVIDPFVPTNVKGASVDVRLGEWFFPEHVGAEGAYVNPWNQNASRVLWGKHPHRALTPAELEKSISGIERGPMLSGEKPDQRFIMVLPRAMVLTHTEEFVATTVGFSAHIGSRSGPFRCGFSVCANGNWGDPGFCGRWSMVVTNHTQAILLLPVGRRIAQLVFEEVEEGEAYAREGAGGKYSCGDSLDEVKARWRPEMMLPKLCGDRECSPQDSSADWLTKTGISHEVGDVL